ncbi:MAG: hypothetical protein JW860_02175 [Sedimentisphaerales bacterium]|nr:hypothetical protein [Sedimentisphaerales bacterium]
MIKERVFKSVMSSLVAFVLLIMGGDLLGREIKAYEEIELEDLKKAKQEEYDEKTVLVQVGLGEITHRPYRLEDKGITIDKYAAIDLRRPGKTKEDEDDKIDGYLLKDSPVMDMYKNYGTGEQIRKTWEKDMGVYVWGTLYYVGGKEFPVAMVIDDIFPTKERPKGNLRYSITVTSFENKGNWSWNWNVGDGFVEMLTDALQKSGWFIVLGDKEMREEAMNEQDFVATGRTAQGKKAPKIGRMTPAQILVKGVITHVQGTTTGGGGGISIKGIRLGGSKDKAEINMTIYMVDSETGQVKASTDIIGKSDRTHAGIGYFGSGLGGLTGNADGHKIDNVGKACQDAVVQAVDYLIKQLDDIPWEGTVSLAKPDSIIINRGQREGVRVGQVFVVGSVEELVDEDTGEVLDVDMTEVGKIEVVRVKEKISYCQPLDDCGPVEKGMTIHPME